MNQNCINVIGMEHDGWKFKLAADIRGEDTSWGVALGTKVILSENWYLVYEYSVLEDGNVKFYWPASFGSNLDAAYKYYNKRINEFLEAAKEETIL